MLVVLDHQTGKAVISARERCPDRGRGSCARWDQLVVAVQVGLALVAHCPLAAAASSEGSVSKFDPLNARILSDSVRNTDKNSASRIVRAWQQMGSVVLARS